MDLYHDLIGDLQYKETEEYKKIKELTIKKQCRKCNADCDSSMDNIMYCSSLRNVIKEYISECRKCEYKHTCTRDYSRILVCVYINKCENKKLYGNEE